MCECWPEDEIHGCFWSMSFRPVSSTITPYSRFSSILTMYFVHLYIQPSIQIHRISRVSSTSCVVVYSSTLWIVSRLNSLRNTHMLFWWFLKMINKCIYIDGFGFISILVQLWMTIDRYLYFSIFLFSSLCLHRRISSLGIAIVATTISLLPWALFGRNVWIWNAKGTRYSGKIQK